MRKAPILAAALLIPLLCARLSAGGQKSAPVSIPTVGVPVAPSLSIPSVGLGVPSLPTIQVPSAINDNALVVPVLPAAQAIAPQAVQLSNGAQQPGAQQPERLIDHLSADIPLMAAPEAGGEEQAATAEEAFTEKAGGKTSRRKKADPPQVPNPPSQPPAPPSGDDGGGPNYPRDTVKFRGAEYPSVAFRPNVPVEPLLIQAIDSAKKSIHLALYEFKLPGVLEALQRARDRGVEIHIVIDYSNVFPSFKPGDDYKPKRSKEIWALLREGFDVKVLRGTGEFGINHNKVMIVDYGQRESLVEYGSFNWSWSAETQHYENANFDTDKALIKDVMSYWQYLDGLAVEHAKAKDHAWSTSVPSPPAMKYGSVDFNGITLPKFIATPTSAKGEDTFEDHLVNAINHVEESLDISIFALRSTRIVQAVVDLHRRGKKVRVIIDEGQSISDAFDDYAQYLAFHGVEVRTLAGPDPNSPYPYAQKNHHKFSIFDGKLVETGSANYTKYAAIANFENAHFDDRKKTVAGYSFVFEHIWGIAKPFAKPAQEPRLPSDAELESETRKAPSPRPDPQPHPGPAPGVIARDVAFNGVTLPSYAFRPDTPIEPLLIRAIDHAEKSIRIAVYEFNLEGVLDALRRAKKRGIHIEIVADRSHVYTSGIDHTGRPRMPSPQYQALISEGFDLLVLKGEKGGIMHNKYLVIDAELKGKGLVEFGSYNWAVTAEVNHYENVKFSNDQHDIDDYLAYFNYKRGMAEAIDHEKLDEVLSRASSVEPEDGDVEPEAGGFPNPDDRTSKMPPPPESTAPMIDINGEQFHRHYFSPQGGIEQAWVRAIKAAKTSVDIAMFAWWSKDVADALVEARKLNPELVVRILLDAGQGTLAKIDKIPAKTWFLEQGFEVKMLAGPNDDGDPMFEKQHNKLMLIDGKWLFTGSFNLSPAAEKNNFENENVVDDPTDVRGYMDFFGRMWNLAWPVKPKLAPPTNGSGKRVAPLGV